MNTLLQPPSDVKASGEPSASLKEASQVSDDLKSRVLDYKNPNVVTRIMDELHLDQGKAEELFRDTIMFLFICGVAPGRHAPTKKIDQGWHQFILHTKDYGNFCQTYFGRMIHHNPGTPKSEAFPMVLNTHAQAQQYFGALSENWEVEAELCGQCGGCHGRECDSAP